MTAQSEKFMTLPYYRVNTARYTKVARVVEDPAEWAHFIKMAKRPLLVIGPRALEHKIGEKLHLEYCLEIAKAVNVPICATAHTQKKILELGVTPESSYDAVEIINVLKDPAWKGVRREGNHDLVVFSGIRCDLAERGLATLKHFAPHLKTMALCRFSHPNANYALPITLDNNKWQSFLDGLVAALRAE